MSRVDRAAEMMASVKLLRQALLWLLGALLLATLLLAGCATAGPRAGFMGATATAQVLTVASAQEYARCHRMASTRAEQDICYDEKNARGEKIGQVVPVLEAAATSLILAEQLEGADAVERARVIMAELRRTLGAHISADHDRAINWLEADQ